MSGSKIYSRGITHDVALAGGSGTAVDGDTDEDETDDSQDLDGGEPELCFTVTSGTEQVDGDDDDHGNCGRG